MRSIGRMKLFSVIKRSKFVECNKELRSFWKLLVGAGLRARIGIKLRKIKREKGRKAPAGERCTEERSACGTLAGHLRWPWPALAADQNGPWHAPFTLLSRADWKTGTEVVLRTTAGTAACPHQPPAPYRNP